MSKNVDLDDDIVIFNHSDLTNQIDKRWVDNFKDEFRRKTNTDLEYLVRAPGRVNIIGDHIDYHGFAVLPMAIESCILLGCSFTPPPDDGDSSSELRIFNMNQDTYPTFASKHSFSHGSQLYKSHQWFHYILCAYHGILANNLLHVKPEDVFQHAQKIERLEETDKVLSNLRGLNILVDSDLPAASGLSSSSALVCASSIAAELLLHEGKDEISISANGLAHQCSKFEHLVGTHGGAMDQAVIMTAQDGYAKYVEFMPNLSCQNVCLPKDVVWLVSHCGSSCAKAATTGFNTRVLETKLTAVLIVEAYENDTICLDRTITLGKVKTKLFAGLSTGEIIETIRARVFNRTNLEPRIPLAQLAERLDTDEETLTNILVCRDRLLSRCEHVFEEAERVEQFKSICDTTRNIEQLGDLMTKSHYSLRDKYDCSHPALDNLVEVALGAGALGARLTGAGWGGCVVAMVHQSKSDYVLKCLKEVSSFTFRTEPKAGCSIIKL